MTRELILIVDILGTSSRSTNFSVRVSFRIIWCLIKFYSLIPQTSSSIQFPIIDEDPSTTTTAVMIVFCCDALVAVELSIHAAPPPSPPSVYILCLPTKNTELLLNDQEDLSRRSASHSLV